MTFRSGIVCQGSSDLPKSRGRKLHGRSAFFHATARAAAILRPARGGKFSRSVRNISEG